MKKPQKVVKHIYDMALGGLGTDQIACRLEEEKIPYSCKLLV